MKAPMLQKKLHPDDIIWVTPVFFFLSFRLEIIKSDSRINRKIGGTKKPKTDRHWLSVVLGAPPGFALDF